MKVPLTDLIYSETTVIIDILDEIPMSSAHRQVLSASSLHLTHCMDPRYGMIPLMIERRVISYRDSERILCYQTSSAMNEFILRLLERKPDSAFQRFISVLEESNQLHVLVPIIVTVGRNKRIMETISSVMLTD